MKPASLNPDSISKILEVIGLTLGPTLLAFNLFNFSVAKIGYYYKDAAQFGIAMGVFLIALALVAKRIRF